MIKCTALLQVTTNLPGSSAGGPHIAGWSESLYTPNNIDVARARFADVCAARSALLPGAGAIVGQRYQIINGGSSSALLRFPGTAPATGIPQKALMCTARAIAFTNTRRFTLRGFPDAWVEHGELKLDVNFTRAFANYERSITNNNTFSFRARDLDAAAVRVAHIEAGVFSLQADLAFIVGDYLQFRDIRNASGKNVSGRFQVLTKTDAQNGTIRGWGTNGIVDLNGFCNKYTIVFPGPIVEVNYARVVSRKVGRPFEQYRGRSARRR